ncbi:MAG: hypothetical protein Q9214_007767 [Letrouitia sp. 1 TL-2023]
MPGSLHNDPFVSTGTSNAFPVDLKNSQTNGDSRQQQARLTTKTNYSGGVQGGITNGAPIYFRVPFKSPATIGQAQNTASYDLQDGVLEAKGRHDPCVVPRAVPIVETMAALVLMDAALTQFGREEFKRRFQQADS